MQGAAEDVDVHESDLTPDELQAFKQAAAKGQLTGLVEPWVPWWSLPEAAEVQLTVSGISKVTVQKQSGKLHPWRVSIYINVFCCFHQSV